LNRKKIGRSKEGVRNEDFGNEGGGKGDGFYGRTLTIR